MFVYFTLSGSGYVCTTLRIPGQRLTYCATKTPPLDIFTTHDTTQCPGDAAASHSRASTALATPHSSQESLLSDSYSPWTPDPAPRYTIPKTSAWKTPQTTLDNDSNSTESSTSAPWLRPTASARRTPYAPVENDSNKSETSTPKQHCTRSVIKNPRSASENFTKPATATSTVHTVQSSPTPLRGNKIALRKQPSRKGKKFGTTSAKSKKQPRSSLRATNAHHEQSSDDEYQDVNCWNLGKYLKIIFYFELKSSAYYKTNPRIQLVWLIRLTHIQSFLYHNSKYMCEHFFSWFYTVPMRTSETARWTLSFEW